MGLPLPKAGTGLMTIAFDLDGTLAEPTWPSPWIGAPIDRGIAALIDYAKRGYEIVVFTSRPSSHRGQIKQWLEDNNLSSTVYDIITDKPRYAMFVDDRAVTFPEAFEERKSTETRARYWGPKHSMSPTVHFYNRDGCGIGECVRLPE